MKILSLALAASVAALGFVAPASAADTTLRISLQTSLKSHLGQNLTMFKTEVEKASAGAINVEIYDSATLYKDNEVPSAVGSGAIEAGVASLTRYVGDSPLVDIMYQPFLFDTDAKVRKAVAPGSPVRGPIDAAIAETGSTVLWWQAYGGSVFLSNGGPIKTPEELKGKKVRVFGKTLGEFVQVAGGAPTVISGSEQYLAYQRGTVDIGMTGVSGVESRKLWEVMDTITVSNNAVIEFIVVVNTEFWEGLPADRRAIIETAAKNAEASLRDGMAEIEAKAYAKSVANGMTVYQPTEPEMAAWKAVSQPVYDTFLKVNGAAGKAMLDAARAF
jgi:C4-dicarboxylate-binding protein DctP